MSDELTTDERRVFAELALTMIRCGPIFVPAYGFSGLHQHQLTTQCLNILGGPSANNVIRLVAELTPFLRRCSGRVKMVHSGYQQVPVFDIEGIAETFNEILKPKSKTQKPAGDWYQEQRQKQLTEAAKDN